MKGGNETKTAVLLNLLQEKVPFSRKPFEDIGALCGMSGSEVLERIRGLKQQKVIRQISAIFDTRSLGYTSSLVASKILPSRLDAAVKVINSHPGVSHNYLRNHSFNVWYTIAVSPDSRLGLEKTVAGLHERSGAESTRLLPTERLFKIGVKFEMQRECQPTEREAVPSHRASQQQEIPPLTRPEMQFVRLMQQDLALTEQPFVAIAEMLGLSFREAEALHDHFLESGRMRRLSAVLHHRAAGFSANAMGIWAAPDDPHRLGQLGEIMAGFRAVSHCYQRPTYPDWPYNLFTMIHGKTQVDCEETLAAIAEATGITDRHALYSTQEFKKSRVHYFTGAEECWEAHWISHG